MSRLCYVFTYAYVKTRMNSLTITDHVGLRSSSDSHPDYHSQYHVQIIHSYLVLC